MRKLLLLGLALVAVYMGGRALKRNAEVLQALWVLIGMTAMAGTANTPKSRSTEARLNSLVPVVFPNTGGTVNGSMTVNGTHSVNGNSNVSGSVTAGTRGTFGGDVITSGTLSNPSGTLTTNGNHHMTGGITAAGGITVGSDMILSGQLSNPSGTVTTNGNHHVTGGITASTQVLIHASGGATLEVGGNAHVTSGMQVDGLMTLSTGSGMPQSAPSTCGSPAGLVTGSALTWANSATSTINSLRSAMISAGVIS